MQLGWDGSKIATSLHPVLSRSFKSMLLSSNPWCFWLWSLVMSLVCFDPSIICHSWRVVWVKVTLWLPSQLNLPIRSISRVKYHQLTWYNSVLLYKDDYQLGCRTISHCQQQSCSGLRSSGWSDSCSVNHWWPLIVRLTVIYPLFLHKGCLLLWIISMFLLLCSLSLLQKLNSFKNCLYHFPVNGNCLVCCNACSGDQRQVGRDTSILRACSWELQQPGGLLSCVSCLLCYGCIFLVDGSHDVQN